MGKTTSAQRLREKIRASVKQSKQMTLDNLPDAPLNKSGNPLLPDQKKQIIITQIDTEIKEDELCLDVGFSLFPSRAFFSKINFDLFFNGQKINARLIRIPQGPLANDSLEFPYSLDMRGIPEGSYAIRLELYELWSSGEKLTSAFKELTVAYVPKTRASKLVKIPTVKNVAGNDLTVLSDSEKALFHEMNMDDKRELIGKRDEW